MRISDWSSDVCSSDLGRGGVVRAGDMACSSASPRRRAVRAPSADRKSVVQGKSVSVRVELGGRRIIKKKTNQHIIVMVQNPSHCNPLITNYIIPSTLNISNFIMNYSSHSTNKI